MTRDSTPLSRSVQLHVDRLTVHPGPTPEVSVLGWCWLPGRTITNLALRSNGASTPCLGIDRPDVAAQYGESCMGLIGFVARVAFPQGHCSIELVGTVDGATGVLVEIAVPSRNPGDFCAPEIRSYSDWLRFREPQLFLPPAEVLGLLSGFRVDPVISILLPTFNTASYYLHRCIQSVLNQHYPRWQLCIADDGSTNSETLEHVRQYASRDRRISVEFRANCGGISAASNSALASATGDYVSLLDHDDELHPSALLEIVRCLNSSPDADLIYSDEDKIDDEGRRFAPAFKPDFDPQLILAFNYIGHLVCIRRSLMEQVRGFRPNCDGSQDWDLLLRVIEQTEPARIKHVTKPLYHWRSHPNSTAMTLSSKPYVHQAWQRVLGDHILRSGKDAQVHEGLFVGSMRLRSLPGARTSIAVVYRSSDGLHQRSAIQKTSTSNLRLYELVLSRLYPAEDRTRGPLLTLNELEGDIVVFLNAPIESLNHRFFEGLVSFAERGDCGIAGSLVLGSDGRICSAGLLCGSDGVLVNPFAGLDQTALGYMGLAKASSVVAGIGSQCFAVRKERLQSVGGLAMLAEDTLTNVCWRLIGSANKDSLCVLYNPYSIMTLRWEAEEETLTALPSPYGSRRVNPNIEAFAHSVEFFRQGCAD